MLIKLSTITVKHQVTLYNFSDASRGVKRKKKEKNIYLAHAHFNTKFYHVTLIGHMMRVNLLNDKCAHLLHQNHIINRKIKKKKEAYMK